MIVTCMAWDRGSWWVLPAANYISRFSLERALSGPGGMRSALGHGGAKSWSRVFRSSSGTSAQYLTLSVRRAYILCPSAYM